MEPVTTAPPEFRHDQWEARVAHVLTKVPPRLRPPVAWLARQWVGRLLARTTAALVRVQIFDRAMTLAAQIFTSVFPLLILVGTLVGGATARRLADWAGLPASSQNLLGNALSNSGLAAFGVVGSLVVLLSSTGLARALTRAYTAVWAVRRVPTGPRASWRWLATVLVLAGYAVATRLLDGLTSRLPRSNLWLAVLSLLADCGVAVLIPWMLMGRAVPARSLAAGAVIFGIVMLVVRPVGSVYLPRALQSSANRYGTIGVAFTYIGWLYVLAFCLLMTAIIGQVVAKDEGALGRLIRGRAGEGRS